MARTVDPDNDGDVRKALAEFMEIVLHAKDRGKDLRFELKEINKSSESPVYIPKGQRERHREYGHEYEHEDEPVEIP